MCHRTRCVDVIIAVGDRIGGGSTACDICGARTVDGGGGTLCAARTKFHNGTSVCGANDSVRFGRNQRLMVESQKNVGFNDLRFDGGGADDHEGFTREDGCAFGNGINIPRKLKVFKIREEFFIKNAPVTQIIYVFIFKVEILLSCTE